MWRIRLCGEVIDGSERAVFYELVNRLILDKCFTKRYNEGII